ncbi:MiaB/RimO family radical SAM methylthiotransferase [Candidatus Karelsulcia muelleri]|uniref:tRNA-t(6)A37 methylthiotransferase n=1 Tax=Candidatus Karelsulcia muelleri TaxID=336810 RepID=A0A346E0T7_9FLAO|nr:MiaB/RimO family radical SAM methylthiotransferase [Candidatus Karelsulcia muelleri]AXN02592.1 tRNA-t(6)A37 methylthiotransferase [Candidatus Karelsulcia muelleri]WDI79533.1 MiaB/RimO family radical SAM methylthiotransferase [Candidatus Karelsulcia muelleri]WDR78990.1 MiaB/RimO family radical SAM methylthiotransferase [Candidatus Karelsulcia muelleri]
MKKISFITYGCKLNYSEFSTIKRNLLNVGYKIVGFDYSSQIYIINTCSITHNADNKLLGLIKTIKTNNKKAKIILLGCYPQSLYNKIYIKKIDADDTISSYSSFLKQVYLVLGNNEKFKLHLFLTNQINKQISVSDLTKYTKYNSSVSFDYTRTRSFIKIQDGCDYKCSYCTIPNIRGNSISENIFNIILTIKKLVLLNIKEVVLTGINLGDFINYGIENKKYDFFYLIKIIEKKLTTKIRIRISSIEPNLLNYKIINFISKSKLFVPHFHIPLQSGSNEILKKMRRRYNPNIYIQKVNTILNILPYACIGTDVIVGFPGENESNFLETFNLLKKINISYIHVFKYSDRDNTYSNSMKNKINPNICFQRSQIIRFLSKKKRKIFYLKNKLQIYRVLFEKTNNRYGEIFGFTENYIRVRVRVNIPFPKNILNTWKLVRLLKIDTHNSYLSELF